MAIAGTTNEDYIALAAAANLQGISIANGYWTDVRYADEPEDIGPDDGKAMLAISQEGASLFLFVRASRPGTQYLSATRDVMIATLQIIGIAKQPTQAKRLARRLHADVYRKIVNNPRLNFGGGTGTNPYCQDSAWLGVDYDWGKDNKADGTVGAFESHYDVTFIFPRATG